MKLRRSARIADMTQHLLSRPHQIIPLTYFKERYQAAKSSISEDLQIIKETLQAEGSGQLMTLAGASGGVKYIPQVTNRQSKEWVAEWIDGLADPGRLLPGGYLYMTDYLSQPRVVNRIGRMFSSRFADARVDYVMTVETKGIPLAYATAQYLNVPFVIVRRDHRVTEGSVVSINYVSGSSKRIQTMSLSRRSIPKHAKVLLLDDFMKAGGTIRGMMDLLQEFEAEMAGACVFVESLATKEKLVEGVLSVIRLCAVDMETKKIQLEGGNIYD